MLSLADGATAARYELEPIESATAERVFERRWAETLVGVALDRFAEGTDGERFETLKGFLLEANGAAGTLSGETERSFTCIRSVVFSTFHERNLDFLFLRKVKPKAHRPVAIETTKQQDPI